MGGQPLGLGAGISEGEAMSNKPDNYRYRWEIEISPESDDETAVHEYFEGTEMPEARKLWQINKTTLAWLW